MSNVMGTSQWINFFRRAGLPVNVAANYAIIFSDNRIQVDMLLDLSKEYLYDMGIKVMGDVIAILKYAKEFHNQLAKEKMIGNAPAITANKAVAGRLVGHYTRTSPIRPPVAPIERGIQSRKSAVISLKRKANLEGFSKKIRRVPPEEEGAYKIKMPSGTTEKTRKILNLQQKMMQASPKQSVFERLGDSAVSSSTDSKISSVFERLGPSSKNICDDTPSSTVTNEFERPIVKGPPLPYRGVLKTAIGKSRTVVTTLPKKNIVSSRTVIKPGGLGNQTIVKTVKLNRINSILQGNKSFMLRTANSPHTQGILGQGIVPQKLTVKSRLGQKVDARNLARTKILLTKKRTPEKSASNVFSRLGW